MTLDYTEFLPALKRLYPRFKVEEILYKNSPFFAMVPKNTNFVGSAVQIPMVYARPQNRSATFATAIAGSTNSELKDFLITRKKDYSIGFIDNEVIQASKNDQGAFLDALSLETRGVLNSLGQSISRKIFGSGSGRIGKISNVAAGVITLSEPNDVVNFEVGMVINTSTADGGGSLRSGDGTVTAVNRVDGTVTYSGTITGIAINDFIFNKGDYDGAISGMDAWIPYDNRAARLAASFYGTVRSADTTRLGGWTKDYSDRPLEEAIIDGAALLGREGGMPDYCWLNNIDYASLQKALGAKVQYVNIAAGTEGHIGFAGIKVEGPTGTITVMPDKNVPKSRMFLTQLNTWTLWTLGEPVEIFNTDGLRMLRSASTDTVEMRAYMYGNLACQAPGYNMQAVIA